MLLIRMYVGIVFFPVETYQNDNATVDFRCTGTHFLIFNAFTRLSLKIDLFLHRQILIYFQRLPISFVSRLIMTCCNGFFVVMGASVVMDASLVMGASLVVGCASRVRSALRAATARLRCAVAIIYFQRLPTSCAHLLYSTDL